jgi:hypothetical protein
MRKVDVVSAILACCRKYENLEELTDGRFKERRILATKARKQLSTRGVLSKNIKVVSDDRYIYINRGVLRVMTICMARLEIMI